ncbi:protein-disulfide reductase DsbD family protein [Sphingomonas sp. Tas61C01]|uniref:protein-disulfide reductase DsbD family protein n=1 Tax=Sphingomonas sp. Tas61C01 TaxID=3458297 RepID=UPI00403EDD1A
MRVLLCAVITLLLASATPVWAQPAPARHLAMRLVAESDAPRAGAPVTLAIETIPETGWHGYWRNPGDAGFPATLTWTLPKGASVGAVDWPVPTTLSIAGLMNYVYERPYAPLVTMRVPAGLAAGTKLPLSVAISYLVCTDKICVPEQQMLSLALTVGDGTATSAASFDRWRRAIPKPLDAVARYAARDGAVTIAVPYPAAATAAQAYFFPVTTGAIDYAAAQTVTRSGDALTIATRGKPVGTIEGVLRIGPAQGLAVRAVPGAVVAAPVDGGAAAATLLAFLGALLGGLILNVMPCVFPILSLKALSLARSGGSERDARREALAYTAGVVLVCLGLGAVILGLRAGGSTVGWAFQLQDPRAIVVLLLLSVAIALNLAGLFEVPMPRFAGEGGASGAFATGALAAFVATPCTGPFMGAALGAALVLPWFAALAIFAGLGLGLALPFLLIGFVPALRRRLPRPGLWMETFRHALSIPMWLTALALAWVLGRQAGIDGMTQGLLAALLLGLLLWAAGRRQRKGLAIGVVLGALILASFVVGAATIRRAAPGAQTREAGAEPFAEQRLAALRAARTPVFVYFTADWCLTCKVNEKAAIETQGVRDAFARNKVAVLLGDWTDGDAAMGKFIQAHNRAGVPLYLYYAPGAADPVVLPQILTPGMLEKLGT